MYGIQINSVCSWSDVVNMYLRSFGGNIFEKNKKKMIRYFKVFEKYGQQWLSIF
jgi:hypothetical protein